MARWEVRLALGDSIGKLRESALCPIDWEPVAGSNRFDSGQRQATLKMRARYLLPASISPQTANVRFRLAAFDTGWSKTAD